MIKRFAFASLAVTCLAGPASAFDAQPSAAAAVDDQVAGSQDAVPIRRVRRIAKPRSVAVLPPQRPEEPAEIAAVSIPDVPASLDTRPASALADAVQDAPASSKVVAVLPPLRPSVGPAASALSDIDQTEPVTADAAPEPETSPARPAGRAVATLPPRRPSFTGDEAPVETAALTMEPLAETAPVPAVVPASSVVPETGLLSSLFGSFPQTPSLDSPAVTISSGRSGLDSLIAAHAKLNGVPADLVHRVVIRESKYNPRAVGSGGAMGLMQIKTATARALGYGGNAAGLLDAETNITYAVKYLAGAYRTANGDYARAISYYARGYYYAQKRNGSIREASNRGRHRDRVRQEADATPPGVTWNTAAIASESSSRVP